MPFPWDEVLHAGLGLLRWPPEMFWRATPREFVLAVMSPSALPDAAAIRDVLGHLMHRFPDERPDNGE